MTDDLIGNFLHGTFSFFFGRLKSQALVTPFPNNIHRPENMYMDDKHVSTNSSSPPRTRTRIQVHTRTHTSTYSLTYTCRSNLKI